MTHETSRRDFLALGGGALAAVWIGSDPSSFRRAMEAARRVTEGRQVEWEVFTPGQAADIEAITAQIIPSDADLPGAREARAVVFIDRSLNSHASGSRDVILDGLVELNERVVSGGNRATQFAQLDEAQQMALLQEIEDTPFFGQIRFSTIVGTFAHPDWGGNFEGAGYKILGFEPRFLWQPPFGEYDAEVNR